jgi:hypothetical protein
LFNKGIQPKHQNGVKHLKSDFALTLILTLLLFCTGISSSYAQQQKSKIHRTWVYLMNDSEEISGYLYEVNDSSISVSDSENIDDYSAGNFNYINVPVDNIKLIKTQAVDQNETINALGGLTIICLRVLDAMAQFEDTQVHLPFYIEIPLTVIGVGFCVLAVVDYAGSYRHTVIINGSSEKFFKNRSYLANRSIK